MKPKVLLCDKGFEPLPVAKDRTDGTSAIVIAGGAKRPQTIGTWHPCFPFAWYDPRMANGVHRKSVHARERQLSRSYSTSDGARHELSWRVEVGVAVGVERA